MKVRASLAASLTAASFGAGAGTPKVVVDQRAVQLRKAIEDPDVRAKLQGIGAKALPLTSAAAVELVKSEGAKWSAVIKDVDVKLD